MLWLYHNPCFRAIEQSNDPKVLQGESERKFTNIKLLYKEKSAGKGGKISIIFSPIFISYILQD